jgi:hypothetical protein
MRIGRATGDGVTLPIPPLLEQLAWLTAKSPSEREALFEDMLPKVVAKAAADQAAATPASAARVG